MAIGYAIQKQTKGFQIDEMVARTEPGPNAASWALELVTELNHAT
jgi:hypothetical protein